MAILDGLNAGQKSAVKHTDGPLLIVAGAGSGKTKTIAHRIAYIIDKGVAPEKILAVTFTNKAAEEMKNRVVDLLKKENIGSSFQTHPFMGTFHSLGVHILKSHGHHIGLTKRFSILDEEDVRSIMKNLIKEFELDPDTYSPQRVRANIRHLKNELITADEFAREHDESPYQDTIANVYTAYEAQLHKMKATDFDDLLLKPVMLLDSSQEASDYFGTKWEYIHIDEYQDTNKAQYILSRRLSPHGNIAVVGDVDQAIYSWRGADWRNLLQFEIDWKHAKVITLEENYRSTKKILEAANAVILNNTERKEKNLRSTKGDGDPIMLTVLENEKQEGLFIVEYVKMLTEQGIKPSGIAVLFRTNAQSRAVEEAFLKKNMPYRLIAGVKFYERKEIKDVLGYLKYALNEKDYISKRRIINTPPRGIGKITLLKYAGGKTLSPKEHTKIEAFDLIIEKVKRAIHTSTASKALRTVLIEAGFQKFYKGNKLEEDRWENIQELLSVANKFDELKPPDGIEKLLTEAALSTQDTEIEDKDSEVILLTAHAAKGLEFDVVIIAGMEEGLFPHSLSQTPSELEEERRLFYVALTRAKEKVAITLVSRRMIYGDVTFNDPSRFLGEIPRDLSTGVDLSNRDGEYNDEEVSIW
jgi:DNA helicase II / ATP-dependent DNA helicase PcrA